jgi:hypothetical protein
MECMEMNYKNKHTYKLDNLKAQKYTRPFLKFLKFLPSQLGVK